MAKQQRMVRVEQKGQQAAVEALETKSDEELERETKQRAAAQAILGSRAAERYDAKAARAHFQKALAAAPQQQRPQIRKMAEVSLAIADRRAGDLKAATDKLGVDGPTGRQLFGLRAFGLIAPPKSAGSLARARGIVLGVLLFVAFIAVIWGVPFGIFSGIDAAGAHMSVSNRVFYAIVVALILIGGLVFFGRRRQQAAKDKRAQMLADRRSGKR
ncbi:MAG: hypothetical protein J2O48_10245 [Solirubrobacterales bacterium]|nr:hypothetical protein [Solirubrobacterales bacterium]